MREIRNYAEELVYWYLRLNGFFPIVDFVLHHKGGDTDVLAIRAPFTSEFVEGEPLKEDKLLVQMVQNAGCDFYEHFTCIIAEAKGGRRSVSRTKINKKFDLESLKYNLRRLGLFKESDIEPVARNLENNRWFRVPNFATIHKILFAESFVQKPDDKFSFISIDSVKDFINKRMKLGFKAKDWDKSNSNMIQNRIMGKCSHFS